MVSGQEVNLIPALVYFVSSAASLPNGLYSLGNVPNWCPARSHSSLQLNTEPPDPQQLKMATTVDMTTKYEICVLRPPVDPDELRSFAVVLRELRLQSLRESPESFTEKYEAVYARPANYWEAFITNHKGLIHIAFGIAEPDASGVHAAAQDERSKLILQHGRPLGMAVNTGPVPQERFLCPPGSQIPANRPDEEEQRFHGSMLFHVADMRGRKGARLVQQLILDRDEWLLKSLQQSNSEASPLARFRGNVKPGAKQEDLLAYYDRAGWYIAGTQSWRSNLMAEGGEAAVRVAEKRGDDMDEVSVVVEKIFTVAQLRWKIRMNKRLLRRLGDARL